MPEYLQLDPIVDYLVKLWGSNRKENEMVAITKYITQNRLKDMIPEINEKLNKRRLQIIGSNEGFLAAAFADSDAPRHIFTPQSGRDHIGGYHLTTL